MHEEGSTSWSEEEEEERIPPPLPLIPFNLPPLVSLGLFSVRKWLSRIYSFVCSYFMSVSIQSFCLSEDNSRWQVFITWNLFTSLKYTRLFYKPNYLKEINHYLSHFSKIHMWELSNYMHTAKLFTLMFYTLLCSSKRFSSILPTVTRRLVLQMDHAKSTKHLFLLELKTL